MLRDSGFWRRAGANAGYLVLAMLAVQGVLAYWSDVWPLTDLIIITSGMILVSVVVEFVKSKRHLSGQAA